MNDRDLTTPDESTHGESRLAGETAPNGREIVLRRSWPQRIIVLACLTVIAGTLALAYGINSTHGGARSIVRIVFPDYSTDAGSEEQPAGTIDLGSQESLQTLDIYDTPRPVGPLLQPTTPPGDPVNFLVVGTDSALGLDPDDPVLDGRYVDPTGRSHADAIMLIRLDPASGSVWVLSIPRDLWAEIPRAQDSKIATALWIGGPQLLVETIQSMFDVQINHYVQVDFAGFESLVDTLGGVPVWFPNPARDPGSRLNIPTAGCHVLTGQQALQYVRGRRYTEQIDGRWQITQGNDFDRIKRQQDFMVLALDRAIDRGARNPFTMAGLIESGASSVALDEDLTLAELVNLAEAFRGFNTENLHRRQLEVYTVRWPDGTYKGEAAYIERNQEVLDIFQGKADNVRPSDVAIRLIGPDINALDDAEEVLKGQGFTIRGKVTTRESIPSTVLIHGPGHADEALTVARYLDPVPYVVERDDVDGVVAALGDDYRGVLFLYQPSLAEVQEQVAARGAPTVVPSVTAVAPESTGSEARVADATVRTDSTSLTSQTSGAGSAEIAPSTSTTTVPVQISGRPPEGESCG